MNFFRSWVTRSSSIPSRTHETSTVSRPEIEPDDLAQREDVDAPEVVVRVGRGEAVEVGAAHRREDERVGLLRRDRSQEVDQEDSRTPSRIWWSETSAAPAEPEEDARSAALHRQRLLEEDRREDQREDRASVWLSTLEIVTCVNLMPRIQRHIDRYVPTTAAGTVSLHWRPGVNARRARHGRRLRERDDR